MNGEVDENNPVIELNTILWLQEQLRLKPGHIADMKDVFGLEYERVDFTDPDTQNVINSKINEASHGLIPGLGIDIDPKTLALLTDIMYFKAQWETPFKEINTDDLLFYGANETVEVPTMCMEERLPYRKTDSYEMVELAYQCESYPERSYAMRVYLPKLCVSFDELLQAIAADENKQASLEHVCLYLPRFSVESKHHNDRRSATNRTGGHLQVNRHFPSTCGPFANFRHSPESENHRQRNGNRSRSVDLCCQCRVPTS